MKVNFYPSQKLHYSPIDGKQVICRFIEFVEDDQAKVSIDGLEYNVPSDQLKAIKSTVSVSYG